MYLESQQKTDIARRSAAFFSTRRYLQNLLALFAGKVTSLLRKEVWCVEAAVDNSREFRSILYVGNRPERHYFGRLFFKRDFACHSLGHYWLWQILFPGKAMRRNNSFCVIQTRWPVSKYSVFTKWHCLPTWVYGSVDLTADYQKFARRSRSARNTLRKIRKNDFKVEISSDLSSFDAFYHRFHQPYMENRHGNSAVEESYNRMKAKFLKGGELLFISKGSKRVAACMLQYKNDGVTAYRLGVRDGDFSWVEKGAISALYFHMMTYCRLRGFQKLNLGGSRPFFSDGVLNYKLRNWNMKIEDHSKHFYFLLKPLAMNPFTRTFLRDNPFVSLKGNDMIANSFFPEADGFPGKDEADRLKTKFTALGRLKVAMHRCSREAPNRAFNKQVYVSR